MSGGPRELAGKRSTELSTPDRGSAVGEGGCARAKLDCLIVCDCNLTAFCLYHGVRRTCTLRPDGILSRDRIDLFFAGQRDTSSRSRLALSPPEATRPGPGPGQEQMS